MHALVIAQGTQAQVDAVRLESCLRSIAKQYSHISVLLPREQDSAITKNSITKLRISATVDLYHSTTRWYTLWLRMMIVQLCTSTGFQAVFLIQSSRKSILRLIQRILPAAPLVFVRLACTQPISTWQKGVQLLQDDICARSAHTLCTDSLTICTLFQKRFGADKCIYTPCIAVEKEAIAAVTAPPVAWDISIVTPLKSGSGIDVILEAVRRIDSCRVLIIGDGPDRFRLEKKIVALALEGKVQLTGWFPKLAEVIASIKSTRMFMMNSVHLQSQYAVVHAMMSAVPVVSISTEFTSGVLVDMQSAIFTTGTTDDIERCIRWYLQHKERRVFMAEKAYNDADQFTVDAVDRAWNLVLQRL
jgi:Glycosyl transferases group 1